VKEALYNAGINAQAAHSTVHHCVTRICQESPSQIKNWYKNRSAKSSPAALAKVLMPVITRMGFAFFQGVLGPEVATCLVDQSVFDPPSRSAGGLNWHSYYVQKMGLRIGSPELVLACEKLKADPEEFAKVLKEVEAVRESRPEMTHLDQQLRREKKALKLLGGLSQIGYQYVLTSRGPGGVAVHSNVTRDTAKELHKEGGKMLVRQGGQRVVTMT
jgi:hypothetical protein